MAEPDKPKEQQTRQPVDGRSTSLTKEWHYQEGGCPGRYYPLRYNSHVSPLICGEETMPQVMLALKSATERIDISLWCFDPALCMHGYNPKLNRKFKLYQSLQTEFSSSPRVGDLLIAAANRGVNIRLLIWEGGNVLYNPFVWRKYASPTYNSLEILWDNRWELVEEYLDLPETPKPIDDNLLDKSLRFLNGLMKTLDTAGRVVSAPIRATSTSARLALFFKKNPDILANWVYRYRFYDYLMHHSHIKLHLVGTPVDSAIVENYLRDILSPRSDEVEYKFLEAALKNLQSHHQKTVLVDYGTENACGFVMGNNLKLVDFDSLSHPQEPPKEGGRWPDTVARQDIATYLRGDIVIDLNDNFERLWATSRPCNANPQEGQSRYTGKVPNFPLVKAVPMHRGKEPMGDAQLSTTLIGGSRPSYIEKAHKTALSRCTEYVYFENQYFRYKPIAQHLDAHASQRFGPPNHEKQQPLYFFAVVNAPDFSGIGTSWDMLEELGHEGQMSGEKVRQARLRYAEAKKELEELKGQKVPHIYNSGLEKKIAALEKELEDLTPLVTKKGIPKDAREYEKAEDAFVITEKEYLKGHVCTMALPRYDKRKKGYETINIHTKTMLVDDSFTIIGSCNMHQRGMERDNEIDVSTARVHVATSLRYRLFGALLERTRDNTLSSVDWKRMYNAWKQRLDENWESLHRGRNLTGFLFYLYDPKISGRQAPLD